MAEEKLAILDSGAQYLKLIDRSVKELSVYCDIMPMDTPIEQLAGYKAIIISGGPQSVYAKDAPKYDSRLFAINKPILGICYGMQLLNYAFGGAVEKKSQREDGQYEITIEKDSDLFAGLDKRQQVLLTHGDSVTRVAGCFDVAARSGDIVACIENNDKKMYGVQFHPEVELTVNGSKILENFLYGIAGFSGSYSLENRENIAIDYVRNTVGEKQVLLLASGGVDSTVCAALLHKALLPGRVHGIHVDHGLMRLNESRAVKAALEKIGLYIAVVDASDYFLNGTTTIDGKVTPKLSDATNPEVKRKIIGDTFIRVAEREIAKLGLNPDDVFLAQGTLRPDLIESASVLASGKADCIKTHHNDTSLVRRLREEGRVIEPLKDYHKDEVRKLGLSLGLPEELVWRQPFPGPGLGVRILCADKPYITDDFGRINDALLEFSSKCINATLLPIQTVGVQGDGRSYSYAVGLSGQQDWAALYDIARQIPKKIHQVNRVVYLFGEKIEGDVRTITPTYLRPDAIWQIQQADAAVNDVLYKHGLLRKLSQVPVILFPADFGVFGNRSVAIRTFITSDFMTGVPAIPGKEMPVGCLDEIVGRVSCVKGISRVAYDLTGKPPGTTEWE